MLGKQRSDCTVRKTPGIQEKPGGYGREAQCVAKGRGRERKGGREEGMWVGAGGMYGVTVQRGCGRGQ